MIAPNPDTGCLNARLYYYDLLGGKTACGVPEGVSEHVADCQFCQDEIGRLRALMADTTADAGPDRRNRDSAIITILKSHFAYLGKSVTCSTVRAFLPSMAVSEQEISIPTPISVHVDNCRACAADLEMIRSLRLTKKQLYRLGQLMADRPAEDIVGCTHAQAVAHKVAALSFSGASSEVLMHLCICPDCRKTVYKARQALRESVLRKRPLDSEFPCHQVLPADVFDYCFSYGIDPADDQYARFRESLTSHLRNCSTCLGKIQKLHNDIYGMIQRPDSGITTCYDLKPATGQAQLSEGSDIYAQWPIDVHVADQAQLTEPVLTVHRRSGPWHRLRFPAVGWTKIAKPLAAAAVVLIGVMLLLSGPAAIAVDLGQIYEALAKVSNLCISQFAPGDREPYFKTWVSRQQDLVLLDSTKQGLALHDLRNGASTTTDLQGGPAVRSPMSAQDRANVLDYRGKLFAIMPFSRISDVPKDAQWIRVTGRAHALAKPDTEVYDLVWTKESNGSVRHGKWRGFIDPRTKLVERVELYEKSGPADEYELSSYLLVEYLTDADIQGVIQSSFDSRRLPARGD